MLPEYNRIKGIHPGAILKRELKKRQLKSVELAKSINEYPQTINAITKERRGINPKLSIKLGDYFNIEKDYFMILQAGYEVKSSIQDSSANLLIGKIRKSIFWDTDFNKIDIIKNKKFIIQRILERGNKYEIEALINLYGITVIKQELNTIKNLFNPNYKRNVSIYIESHDHS